MPLRLPLAAALLAFGAPALAQPSEQQLQEVVVSASGFEQVIKEAPASISVITREQMESKRVSSVAEALEHVEGIDVTSGIGKTGGLNVRMRGLDSAYTLILIDGRRQNAAGNVVPNGFGDAHSTFMPPPSAIERIEVIRGPMATLYGSDAIGGVINIITRKVGKEWAGEVGAETTLNQHSEYGDSRAVTAYLSGPLVQDRLGLQLRARMWERDASDINWAGKGLGQFPNLNTGKNPVNGDVTTLGARLTFTPNKNHDLSLDVDQVRQDYDNSLGQIGTTNYVDGAGRLQISGYDRFMKFNRDQLTLAHTWRVGDGVLESSLMHNETETLGRLIPGVYNADGSINRAPTGKIPGAPRVLESESTVFDTKYVTALDAHMLSIGAQYWDAKMMDSIAAGAYKYDQKGVFVEDEWRLRDDLALTLGVRHDRHSVFGGATTPRAYLVWSANDNWTLKGGVSKGYRTPGLEQLYDGITGYGRQGDPTRPQWGNPALQPEKSVTSEFGVHFDNLRNLNASATIFTTELDDAIGSETFTDINGMTNASRPINVDKAAVQGLEVAAGWRFMPAWKLSGNYTYTRTEQKSGANIGDPLNNTPRHALNARLDWNATEALGLWAQASFAGERFRDDPVARALIGDYKSVALLHVGGSYRINKAWSVKLAVNNLLDKDFTRHTLTDNSGASPVYSSHYTGNFERRRLWLSANYTF